MLKRPLATVIAALLLILPVTLVAAELKLAAPFADHMVLQRDKPVSVWGWADAGERITVEFAGQQVAATADKSGKWLVKLDPLAANDKPRKLTVTSASGGSASAADVLVGEVWLGSGQSNMAMTVSRARDFEQEQAASNLPLIRMFKESSGGADAPQADAQGSWEVCSPDTVGNFSATLFFFGRELHRELKVPVGLINSSVGGTPIESWIAAKAQARTPELKASYEAAAQAYSDFDVAAAKAQHEKALEAWKSRVAQAKAGGRPQPRRPGDPVDRRNRRAGPGGLFNGKIAPLVPYAIRGAVWYQGEANARPGTLYEYQLPLLVSDWRARWGDQFPFAWVQLPNFGRTGDGWMLVREAMLKSLRLPQTGMAITVDVGETGDIHPKNKQDVGKRLAFWALGDVYEKKGVATSGPLPAGHQVRGNRIIVSFTHCDGGLQAKGGELTGFEIAAADKEWKAARARIDGETVVVTHPEVNKPVAVRYAWAAAPVCNLYNGAGLPASPFRTGDEAGQKIGQLLFEDDFARDETTPDKEEIGGGWTSNSAWRAKGHKQVDLVDGAMHVTRHAEADHGVAIFQKLEFQDGAVQMKFKLGDSDSLGLDFVDRDLKSVHAGHLCIARVTLNRLTLTDSKTGTMDNQIRERRLAGEKSPELAKLLQSKTAAFPLDLAADQWHTLLVTVEGDVMQAAVDGRPVGEFQSEGIAHPTKRMITLAVNKSAWVDDVKVWKIK